MGHPTPSGIKSERTAEGPPGARQSDRKRDLAKLEDLPRNKGFQCPNQLQVRHQEQARLAREPGLTSNHKGPASYFQANVTDIQNIRAEASP